MGSVFTTNRWVGQSADNSLTGPGGQIHERVWIGVVISPACADVGVCFTIVSTAASDSKAALRCAPLDGGRVFRCGNLRRAAAQK